MKKPNFPAFNIASVITKAARAGKSLNQSLQYVWYDAEKGFGYATDGKQLLRARAADFGANPENLKTGYYAPITVDGYPRLVPVECVYTFPNCEAVIPSGQGDSVFAEMSYQYHKSDAASNNRQRFMLNLLVFHASKNRAPKKPGNLLILSDSTLEAVDKSGTDWHISIYSRPFAVTFRHDEITVVAMPVKGFDNQVALETLEACGLWPKGTED